MSQERTDAQKAAARLNGAKSRGPTSILGKRISSRNALKHVHFADLVLFPDEDRNAFCALSTNFFDVLDPRNDLEDLYVKRMIEAEWQLVRIRDFEQASMMVEISAQGPHPAIPIDEKVWTHPAARIAAAFQKVHGRSGSGSVIQTSKARYLREFKEAQTQLFRIRENSSKWRLPYFEPGQLSESIEPSTPETEPEPDLICVSQPH